MRCVTTMKITDKKQLSKLVSFLTMGDGSVYSNRNSKNHIFSLNMTEEHLDFIEYTKSILDNITTSRIIFEQRELPRKNQYKVYTPVHPYFNKLRERIYTGSYKSIDPHSLKLLDYEALAILYMCDGCLGKYTNKSTGYTSYSTTINMCRLSYGDLLLLKKAIKENLDIEFNVVKTGNKYYCLRLRHKDFDKFMKGISNYILPSFLYKLEIRTDNPLIKGDEIV